MSRLPEPVPPAEIAAALRRRAADLRATARSEELYGRTIQATAERAMVRGLELVADELEAEA